LGNRSSVSDFKQNTNADPRRFWIGFIHRQV